MKKEIWQDGTGNYLKVLGETVDDFSEKIFLFQDIQGFLPMEVRKVNGEKELFYPVAGKITLEQYLSQNYFDREDVRRIVGEILDMADQVEEYLLDCKGIVLQDDLLFVDQKTGKLEGIYGPVQEKGFIWGVGNLLEAVMEKMDHRNRELVFFVYGMHTLTKEAGCTRGMLREYILEENHPTNSGGNGSTNEKKLPAKKKQYEKVKEYLLPGLICVFGILCTFIVWRSGVLRTAVTGKPDIGKMAGSLFFVIGVTGYGIYRTMPQKLNAREKKDRKSYLIREREEDNDKGVCLIPQKKGGEPLQINEFPFRVENTRIIQRGNRIIVVDEESDGGTFVNDRRLVPWEEFPVQDGDILQCTENEYVVEITQSSYVM